MGGASLGAPGGGGGGDCGSIRQTRTMYEQDHVSCEIFKHPDDMLLS
jgi:hypothetical protein